MVTFWKAPGCDQQKDNLRREVAFDEDAWDMANEMAGIKSINSSCAIYLMFITSKQKHTRGEKVVYW